MTFNPNDFPPERVSDALRDWNWACRPWYVKLWHYIIGRTPNGIS